MPAASRFQRSSLGLLGIVGASSIACAHPYGVPRERGAVVLTTEVEIAASRREVWDLLVDAAMRRYGDALQRGIESEAASLRRRAGRAVEPATAR